MFSTPIVRSPAQNENTNRLMLRKPGTLQVSRKPFADRCVNAKSPEITQPGKTKSVKKVETVNSNEVNLEFYEDFCSYKDDFEDLYEERLPNSERLSKHFNKIIYGEYIRDLQTPPPPEGEYNDFEEMFVPLLKRNEEFKFTEDTFSPPLLNDSLEDVSLPSISLDYDYNNYYEEMFTSLPRNDELNFNQDTSSPSLLDDSLEDVSLPNISLDDDM